MRSSKTPTSAALGQWRPDLLILVLAAMLLTYVWRVQNVLPGLDKLRLGLLLGVAVIGVYAIDHLAIRRFSRISSVPLTRLMIAFVLIGAITIPTSLWPGKSASQLLITLVPNAVLGIILAAGLRSFRDADFLLKVLLGGGLFFCSVGLVHSVGVRLGGVAFYDPNDLALVVVTVLPVAIYLIRPKATRTERLIGLISLGMFVLVLVRSGSRGGFLGFAALMIYVLLRFTSFPKLIRLKAVAAGVVLLFVIAGPAYWSSMQSILDEDDYNRHSPTGRMEVWKRGLGYIASNPLLGVGLTAYPQAEGRSEFAVARAERGRGMKWSVAHNAYLEVGVEQGIPGLVVFLGFFLAAPVMLSRSIRQSPDVSGRWAAAPMAQTLMASLVGFMVCSFFISAQHFSILYVILGMSIGVAKLTASRPPPHVVSGPSARTVSQFRPGVVPQAVRPPRVPVGQAAQKLMH
jgi:O-antigen ligase